LGKCPTLNTNRSSTETLRKTTKNYAKTPAKETHYLEFLESLLLSQDESLLNEWCALLAGNPNWCALSLPAQATDVESSCN
jgi:hypothetical protein